MKFVVSFMIMTAGQFAKASLTNFYCFNGSKENHSAKIEDLIEKESDYVLSFNASESKFEAALKHSGEKSFSPLFVIDHETDQYGEVLLSGLVLSQNRPRGGSVVRALRVQPFQDVCDDKILSVEKGVFGGFAGAFTPNLSEPTDVCFCTTD